MSEWIFGVPSCDPACGDFFRLTGSATRTIVSDHGLWEDIFPDDEDLVTNWVYQRSSIKDPRGKFAEEGFKEVLIVNVGRGAEKPEVPFSIDENCLALWFPKCPISMVDTAKEWGYKVGDNFLMLFFRISMVKI